MAQVFIITVQNEVPRSLVGSATAMMVFSRTMGAALGVAVMGAIVNAGFPPDVQIEGVVGGDAGDDVSAALASALQPAFVAAACAALLILPLTVWGIGRIELRTTVEDDPPGVEALPDGEPVSRT
jgi:hypothetical protein